MDITNKRLEIVTSILLAVASLLAAWCAFQASAWNSNQATASQRTNRLRTESTRALTRSGQQSIVDVITYINWLEATNANDQQLADFYRVRFREEFKPAFDAWLATEPLNNPDAPKTPFEMAEYQLKLTQDAATLETQADEEAQKFAYANTTSTDYVRNTLFIASALFLSSISSRFEYRPVRIAVLVLAALMFLAGLGNAIALPKA
jgi:hypothetical protein